MRVQVLGTGCLKCKKMYEMVVSVARDLGMKDMVEYITGDDGIQKMIELGVMSSPVLVIDGKVAMVGFIPDIEKIKGALRKA
ncbi:MAG: Redox-active disulfide protein 2 [Microgenomates group bacterium GW2011_GWF2_45_18]|nr:MAG: Redox-active disulfide protein 2 [Microgenomates group bacterium GW2011_GWF1_44_10]KKU02126.1 MAG: Redox-active disulfide protein 2 [Microgenomates group bacterium GW2011_GWF2_45_18]OGJ41770.1 MAG: hypothetical protein A2378_00620 [Candidatus Pacebacteria bacterium RIFOXYB1_FULL_44_10]HAU98677.1 thioredoxin family protein [Candidatus Paceibacterota bacterium]HAX01897.1 thioredoxin family protein [Candidatus Paceibacterota bacterium]